MPLSSISFLADCPICNQKVSATTVLGRDALTQALADDAAVQAVHMADIGDHKWNLTKEQKANLRKRMAEGLL
jgi:hypothetical protein